MTRTAHWTLGILVALYATFLAGLQWYGYRDASDLVSGTQLVGCFGWLLWRHHARREPLGWYAGGLWVAFWLCLSGLALVTLRHWPI